MKGGGFLILIFLLICFLWGITAVVGRIGRVFSLEDRHKKTPQSPPLAAVENSRDNSLEQLERVSRLHKEGALSDDEFMRIKEKLIQNI